MPLFCGNYKSICTTVATKQQGFKNQIWCIKNTFLPYNDGQTLKTKRGGNLIQILIQIAIHLKSTFCGT